jgi:hypothetical protein
MSNVTDTPEQPRSEARAEWDQPTVSLVGGIMLVVRAGSALGKHQNGQDSDPGTSFCNRPGRC